MGDMTPEERVIKLVGCPFCGEATHRRIRGISFDESINSMWEVYCDCGARGPTAEEQELAIRGWNRRLGRRFSDSREAEDAAYERAAIIADDDHLYGNIARKIRALKHGDD